MATDPTEVVAGWLNQKKQPTTPDVPLYTAEQFENTKTLHETLKIAIHDFEQVLKQPEAFVVNMDFWLKPMLWSDNKKCSVCLAGAVLVTTYNKREYVSLTRDHCDLTPLELRMLALNSLRMGRVHKACCCMNIGYDGHKLENIQMLESRYATALASRRFSFFYTSEVFLSTLKNLQQDLEKYNI